MPGKPRQKLEYHDSWSCLDNVGLQYGQKMFATGGSALWAYEKSLPAIFSHMRTDRDSAAVELRLQCWESPRKIQHGGLKLPQACQMSPSTLILAFI